MLQHLASLQSIGRSLAATVALLLVVMLIAGGAGISGAAILTFSIWISMLGLLAVGTFLIARAQRTYAGAGAIVAAVSVWMAYFWRSNPGPFLKAQPTAKRGTSKSHAVGEETSCRVP